ncbi:hypothetical protein PT2222_310031 [Paraburkholderia tropica]
MWRRDERSGLARRVDDVAFVALECARAHEAVRAVVVAAFERLDVQTRAVHAYAQRRGAARAVIGRFDEGRRQRALAFERNAGRGQVGVGRHARVAHHLDQTFERDVGAVARALRGLRESGEFRALVHELRPRRVEHRVGDAVRAFGQQRGRAVGAIAIPGELAARPVADDQIEAVVERSVARDFVEIAERAVGQRPGRRRRPHQPARHQRAARGRVGAHVARRAIVGERGEAPAARHAEPRAAADEIAAREHVGRIGPPLQRRGGAAQELVAIRGEREARACGRLRAPVEHDQAHGARPPSLRPHAEGGRVPTGQNANTNTSSADNASDLGGQCVGQRQEAQRGAVGGAQMHAARFERRELDLGEQIDAAFGRRGRIHDHAAGLARIVGMEQLDARTRGVETGRDARERRAPLDRAAILAARDHFLTRIAALLEVHAAEHVVVDHLRHELLAHGLRDARLARVDVEPVPQRGRDACDLAVERGEFRFDRVLRTDQQIAQTAGRVGQADQRAGGVVDLDVHAVGQCVEHARQRATHVAREADHEQLVAVVDELGLGAQHEHRQAFLHRGLHVLRDQQADRLGAFPDEERSEQAALGRAVAREARARDVQMLDVVGELAVQESSGVFAVGVDHAELRQDRVGAALERGVEVGGGRGGQISLHGRRGGKRSSGSERGVHGFGEQSILTLARASSYYMRSP